VLRAGDRAADAAWRGIDNVFGNNQPRFASVGVHNSQTTLDNVANAVNHADNIHPSGHPSYMAIEGSGAAHRSDFPSEIGDYSLGNEIGSGGFGTVFDIPDNPELAIKMATQSNGKVNKQLVVEASNLRLLRDRGYNVPYVDFVESTGVDGVLRQAIIMKKIDGVLSKKVLQTGKFAGATPTSIELGMVTQKTLSDLKELRKIANDGNLVIDDLQFMIDRSGSIHIIDPARVRDLSLLKPNQAREQKKNFLKRIDTVTRQMNVIYNDNL
jgi:hypothetical protein